MAAEVAVFSLSARAPVLARGHVVDLPRAAFGLKLPAPEVLRPIVLPVPAAELVLTLLSPTLLLPNASRRRVAIVGASENGGLVNVRAPGALISDGITGGSFVADERI